MDYTVNPPAPVPSNQSPLFPRDTSSDIVEYQSATHPVPFGYDSVLSDLQENKVKAADAILHIAVNYLSEWKSCKSHYLSIKRLSECLRVSPSYVSKILKRISRFLKKIKSNRKGSIFEVIKHAHDTETPADGDSRFLAVPFGLGSPIERMMKGHISWKSCLVWLMLKLHSDWTTGVSHETNMLEIADRCGLGSQTVCECIKELESAKLLKRTSDLNEPAVYQLFPKPKPKKAKNEEGSSDANRFGHRTSTHIMSRNWQYRISLADGLIEKRVARSKWKRASDYELVNVIPKVIVNDLDLAFNVHHSLRGHLVTS